MILLMAIWMDCRTWFGSRFDLAILLEERKLAYPNEDFWAALHDGRVVEVGDNKRYTLSIVDCGVLQMPSGQLIACDPFVGLEPVENAFLTISPGQYRVIVTLADVSTEQDGSHLREAYATLILDESAQELSRKIISPTIDELQSIPGEMSKEGEYQGFFVDAGTACFVDNIAVQQCMPKGDWCEELFETDAPNSWFDAMDDPDQIRNGIANIVLPHAQNGENIILIHSGWGDGVYPVVGGYDEAGNLIRVHIDFMVVFDDRILKQE
jgi:hypothetical protein